MPQPEEIPFSESARNKRRQFQTKGLGSRLGRALSSRAIDRPRIGKRKRSIRGTDIDLPTGGIRGSKKPTGTNIDVDRDGWVDEGTRRPRWVGLSSGKPEEVVRTRIDKSRPIIKINKPEEKIDKSRAHKLKNYKYGDESVLGGKISIRQGPDWLKGLTNEQISSLLVPDSIETQYKMWLDNYGAGSLIKGSEEEVKFRKWFDNAIEANEYNKFDYSPESRAATRKAVEAALEDSPLFSWAVRNYGSPVFGVVTPKGRDEYVARPQYKALIAKFANSSVDKDKQIFPKAMASLDLNMVSFFPNYVVDRKTHDIDGPVPMNMNPLHVPSRDDAVMNRSLAGTVVHEWAHWLHQMALRDSERMGVKSERKYFGNNTNERYVAALKVAAEYSDTSKDFLKLHEDRVSFDDSPNVPRTVTSYGHANMREAMAEGMVAYMHPNQDLKNFAINNKLRKDVETLLGGKDGTGPWSKEIDKQTSLGSGRRERRSNPKGIRLEKTIPGENRRNSLSSGAEEKIEFESVQKSVEDLLDLTATYFDIPDDTEGPLDVRARERANTRVFRQTKDSGVPDEPITPDEWFSMDVMEVRRVSMDALDLNGQPTGEKINVIMHSPRMHEIEERAREIGESVHQEVLARLEKILPEGIVRPSDVDAARAKLKEELDALELVDEIETKLRQTADQLVEEALNIITKSDGRDQTLVGSRYWNFLNVDTANLAGSGQARMMTPEVVEEITLMKNAHIQREEIVNKTLRNIDELIKLGFLVEATDDGDRQNGRRVFVPKSTMNGELLMGEAAAIVIHDVIPTNQPKNAGMMYIINKPKSDPSSRRSTPWRDIPEDSGDSIHISEIINQITSVAVSPQEREMLMGKFDGRRLGGLAVPSAIPDELNQKMYAAEYGRRRAKLLSLMTRAAGAPEMRTAEEVVARVYEKSDLREKRRKVLVPYRMAYRDVLLDVINELLEDDDSKKPDLMTATGGMGAEKLNEIAKRFLPSEIIRQINLKFGEGDYPYKKNTGGRYKTKKKGIYAIKKASGGGEAHFAENNELLGYLQPDGQLIAAGYSSITIPDGSLIVRGNDSVKVNVDDSAGSNLHELTHVVTFANPLASLLENLFFQRRMAGGRKGKREESLSKRINRGATRPTLNKLTDTNWEGDYGNPVGTGRTPRKKRSLPDMQVFDDQFLRTYQGRVYSEKQGTPSKETFTVGMQNLFVPEEEIVASPEIDHDSNNFVIGSLLVVAAQAKRERLNPERQIRNRTSIMVTEPQQVPTFPTWNTGGTRLPTDVVRSVEISEIDLPVQGLSSGKKITPEQRSAIRGAEKTLRDMGLQITEIGFVNKKTGKTRQSPIFSVSGRAVVLVDVNGVRVPFYRSSGSGGKKNVPSGRWYPIFGIGKEQVIYDGYEERLRANGGWFNKGSEEEIVDYYGVPELRRIAENLDSQLEDLPNVVFNDVRQEFKKSDVDKVAIDAGVKTKPMHRSINDSLWEIIHRDLHPVNTYRESPRENIDAVVAKIKSGRVKLEMDSLSPTVKKDRLYVSKKSKLIRKREVELEIKDKNGEVIRVTVDAEEDTRYGQAMKRHNVTVVMTRNNRQVGILHARTDGDGLLGNPDKLTISEILVPEDFQRRGHGRAMLAFASTYNIGSEKVYHSSKRSELGELFATGTGLSSGKKPLPKIPKKSNMTPGDMRYDDVAGNGDGDCFPAASNLLSSLVLKNPERVNDFRVVHGIPLGTGGDAEGKRFHHAWVEETVKRTDKEVAEMLDRFPEAMREGAKRQLGPMLSEYVIVHDHSNGRELRMPKEVYYAFGQIEEPLVQKYSFTDLSDEQLRVGHHGPYGVDGADISQTKRGTKKNRPSRRGNSVYDAGGSSLSSGAKYEEIVKSQPRPSDEQINASNNIKDLLKLSELRVADEWTVTGQDAFGDDEVELTESADRANLKEEIKKNIVTLFTNEIELENDIIVESRSGEKINLGRKIKITPVVKDFSVDNLSENDIKEQRDEMGKIILDGSKPVTSVSIRMSISPADDEAVARLIRSGIPEQLIDIESREKVELGNAYRQITSDGNTIYIGHESIFIGNGARKYGIASAVNGRNESMYSEMGADSIITLAASSTSDQDGATHWARNGFTWMGEPSKQKFIKVIDDAITNYPGLFSEEERKRISSLYKNQNGEFKSSATPEELINFSAADQIFKDANDGQGVTIYFKRGVEKPSRINSMKNRMRRRVGPVSSSSSLSSGSGEKPAFPRKPTYGPFIGRANEVFGRARTWQEFKEIYENTEITYIDYETTGLVFDEFNEPSGNGFPTQIGAVKMKNGKVVARFETYVNPGIPTEKWEKWSQDTLVDYDGKKITNDFIERQMSIAEAHKKLSEFIGPNAILGVQNAAFDKDVLEDNLTASNIDWRPDGWIDLKDVAALSLPRWSEESPDGPKRFDKKKDKFVPSNSLKDITEYLGVELGDKHHTADADAEATAKSMAALIKNAVDKEWSTELFNADNRLQKIQKDNEKFNSEIETFRSNKDKYLGIERVSSLSSGGASESEKEEARRLRRVANYEKVKAKGEGKESILMWDENGNYKERATPNYDLDEDSEEDNDDDDDDNTSDNGYELVSAAEMARRNQQFRASQERLNSPEYMESSRLARVARNKGKETNLHNADGTMKVRGGEKLSSGASGNKKFQKQLKLIEEAVSRSSSRGVETYSYKQGDITPELVDELEKEITNFEREVESIGEKIEEEMEKLLDSNKSQKIKDALYEQLDKERESIYKLEESARIAYLASNRIKSFSARDSEQMSASGWTTEIHISRDSAGRITGIAVTGVQMEKQARVLANYFEGVGDVGDGKALYIDYVVSLHKEKDSGRTLLGSILEDAQRDGVSLVQIEPTDTSTGYWDMFGFTAAKRKNEFAVNGPIADYVFLKLDTPQDDEEDK